MNIPTSRSAALFCVLGFLLVSVVRGETEPHPHYLAWEHIADLPPVGAQTEPLGVAGPFVGVHNDALIVAGGANFPPPLWETGKVWHDDIWVLTRDGETYTWHKGGSLPRPLGYGASVSTQQGVLCMGGNDADLTYADVFLLRWDPAAETVQRESLPSLPKRCAFTAAAVIGNEVYLAGGTETNDLASAMDNFWRLDLAKESPAWETLPSWPGPTRGLNLVVAQHDGFEDHVFVLSGRRVGADGELEFLKDGYAFNPKTYRETGDASAWKRISDSPVSVMAGEGFSIGQSHIFILGGADGSLFHIADELKERHPGFPKKAWAYHTITNTWFEAGPIPQNHVTTQPAKWGDDIIIASGEIRPRTRTPVIWKVTAQQTSSSFGWLDYSTIGIYLLALIGIGVFFSFRNRSTEDYFRGGQRVPWWAAGCSIFATMLSSLTFMSIPAKAYATDWVYFLINMSIIALAPFIIAYILPFFRSINATSAYEYLEMRFNLAARLLASAFYILFQIGRMAIVMFLPALALTTVAPISVEMCILLMGVMSLIYCTLGGVEAVIWTDTLQTFVLLGGALLSFILILLNLDGGFGDFIAVGVADQKFHMINWNWGAGSFTTTALWVIVLGGIAQQLVPYSSDQGIVQRYMSVPTKKKAAQSIWTNAGLSFFASILFFALGTGLYVFYKEFPQRLDPSLQNDSVFPQFIASQLPAGIAGLVIAGVFAAAQSTVSTSMNSIATAFTTDFVRRFDLLQTETGYFRLAQGMTFLAGILGTGFALFLASADVKSLWDTFMGVLGLLGGPMGGLFILGMFTRRANGTGAVLGAVVGALAVLFVQRTTSVSVVLHTAIGLVGCVGFGYLLSLVLPAREKPIEGLTITSRPSAESIR